MVFFTFIYTSFKSQNHPFLSNDSDTFGGPYIDQVLEGIILFDGCFQDMLIFDIYQLQI